MLKIRLTYLCIILFVLFPFFLYGTSASCDSSEIGILHDKAEGIRLNNPKKALELAEKSLDLSLSFHFSDGILNSRILLAEIYMTSASYEKALEYYLQVLNEYEERDDFQGIAKICSAIGKINTVTGNYEKALQFYKRALDLNKKLKNVREIASGYSDIGQIYVLQDSIDRGLSHYLVSYMITDSLKDTVTMTGLLNNVGNGYLKLNRYEQAMTAFVKELHLAENQNDRFSVSRALFNIGNTCFRYGDHPGAIENINKSLDIAKKGNFNKIIQDNELILSSIYEAAGNYAMAYKHHQIYKDYSDSIINEDKLRQLSELQSRYEIEKKEKENKILRMQNMEITKDVKSRNKAIIITSFLIVFFAFNLFLLLRANRKYKKLNSELSEKSELLKGLNVQKDRFFSFVVHNLNNPFHTIWGFSELLLKHADSKDTERMVRYSKYIYDSSHGIKQILSNLLEWTTLQHGNYEYNPSRIELESMIKDTLELNSRMAAEKDISFTYQNILNKYAYADRRMVYTVLQNLISNAIRFTPSGGKIKISSQYNGHFIEISVSDTGIGIPPKEIKGLFKPDFSPQPVHKADTKGTGMGLIICKELVTKNGGEIKVDSVPGKGSTFIFTLPLPDDEIEFYDTNDHSLDSFIKDIKENLARDISLSESFLKEMNALMPAYEYLSKAISVEDLKDFAGAIMKHSKNYHIEPLNRYGEKLFRYAEKLQFDKILKILPEFPELLREAGLKKVAD